MDLRAKRLWVAWKKLCCLFLKCTIRYKSHLLNISGGHSQKVLSNMSCIFVLFFTFYAVCSCPMCL